MAISARKLLRYLLFAPTPKASRRRFVLLLPLLVTLCILFHTNVNTPKKDLKPAPSRRRYDPMQFLPTRVQRYVDKAYKQRRVGFPDWHLKDVNCQQVVKSKTRNYDHPGHVKRINSSQFLEDAKESCSEFQEKYGFNRYPPASKEEREFPLAFVFLFHKDLDQMLFLLRAMYRSHNVYCLHPDASSEPVLRQAVTAVAACLTNVIVASKLERVIYDGFSRLQADLNCMHNLLSHPVDWKYAINLPGQQFPLKTNLEMVKIIKLYRGANDIEGMTGVKELPERYLSKHIETFNPDTGEFLVLDTGVNNPPPKNDVRIVKGSAYNTYSRAFLQFALTNPKALEFLSWSKAVRSPDEYFWASLHHSKHLSAPGGYRGVPEDKPWLTSFSSWAPVGPCSSRHYVRSSCIFSPGDLPVLTKRPELTANKFYIDFHPVALHCLDQFIFNKTVSSSVRDLTFYRHLNFALP